MAVRKLTNFRLFSVTERTAFADEKAKKFVFFVTESADRSGSWGGIRYDRTKKGFYKIRERRK